MPEDRLTGLRRKIVFFYSPLVEMLLSLHVLHDPERYGVLLPWMVRFREKVSPEIMRDLRYFGDHCARWIGVAEMVLGLDGVQELGVPGFIEWLEGLDEPAFAARLLGEPAETAPGAPQPEVPAVRARLTALLAAYWAEYFREEFYWVELLLIRSIKEASIELERGDPREFLARLSGGGLTWDAAGRLVPRAADPRELPSLDRIHLFPSVFVYPETLVVSQPRRVFCAYPVSPGVYLRRDTLNPPENLSLLLKVLADDTRLKILKLMAEKRRFTQELASELDLAEPTVSRHIKLLREAELITSEKEGNYIYYSLRLERVAEVQTRLLDFFRS